MTYFIARFPQYNKPVFNPKPEDYLDAQLWYLAKHLYLRSEKFKATYRRLRWAQETAVKQIEQDRAG